MARRKRRGTPEEWFHRADQRIPPARPAPEDGPVDGGHAVRKVWSVFHLWMICPLGRCRRARLCLTRKDVSACNGANREAVRPHLALMRAELDRAMAMREAAGGAAAEPAGGAGSPLAPPSPRRREGGRAFAGGHGKPPSRAGEGRG
jgi:hypothetical protein